MRLTPRPPLQKRGGASRKKRHHYLWPATYSDLDAQEQEQANVAILQDDSLGATTEEREIRLSKARRTSKVLNIAGGAVAAWLLFQPDPYHWAVAAGLALPWLTAAALWLHPAALSLVENKNSAHPSPSLALLLPALALLLRGVLDFEILNYQNLWLPAAVVTIGLAGGLLTSTRHFVTQSDSRLSTLLTALGYAALYGFAATLIVNCAYDEGHATKHTARVLRKHVSSGKTTTYYLEVSSWGPRRTAADVVVSRDYYQQLQVGNEVRIHQMPGRLSVPWFTVIE